MYIIMYIKFINMYIPMYIRLIWRDQSWRSSTNGG
jgi:hypothetical protein